jgi:hypothetical protein
VLLALLWTAPALQEFFGVLTQLLGFSLLSGLFTQAKAAGHDEVRGSDPNLMGALEARGPARADPIPGSHRFVITPYQPPQALQ